MGRGGSWGILSAEASPDTQSGPTPAFLALTAPLAPGQPLRPCALPGPAAAGEEGRRSRPSGAAGASSHRKSESGYSGTQAPEVVIRDWAPAARGTSGGAGPVWGRGRGRVPLSPASELPPAQPHPASPGSAGLLLVRPLCTPRRQAPAGRWAQPSAQGPLGLTPRALCGRPRCPPAACGDTGRDRWGRGTWRAPGSAPDSVVQTASSEDLVLWPHVKDPDRRCSDGSEAGLPGALSRQTPSQGLQGQSV